MESKLRFKEGDAVRYVGEAYRADIAKKGSKGLGTVAEAYSYPAAYPYRVEFDFGEFWLCEHDELVLASEETQLTGGSSDYYKLPPGATDIMDLIEHKDMGFALGNIFKAVYRLGDKPGTTQKYDLEKIIYFAQRELDRLSP